MRPLYYSADTEDAGSVPHLKACGVGISVNTLSLPCKMEKIVLLAS